MKYDIYCKGLDSVLVMII